MTSAPAVQRVTLTADFTHHDETGERTYTAGLRNMSPAAVVAARRDGLIAGPAVSVAPRPARVRKPKAKAKPAAKAPATAKPIRKPKS